MIGKRIRRGARRARGNVAQLHQSVQALSAYVVDANPEKLLALARVPTIANYVLDARRIEMANALAEVGVEFGEKVRVFGTRNLVGDTLQEWQEEMLAIAARCPRAKSPVEHYVLSWKEGELPADDQAREAIEIFVDVLGADQCQVIWSVHENTQNRHAHVMLVRVDPASARAVKLGDGWDVDRIHQALALIEERQGWSAEPDALFVSKNGAVFDRKSGQMVRDRDGNQLQRTRRTRDCRPLIESKLHATISDEMDRAKDWADLHRRLDSIGVAYRKSGSGARMAIGKVEFKASALDADWSRPSLEERFRQAFEPHRSETSGPAYEDYRHAASAELARIRSAHEDARARLAEARDHTLSAVASGPHAAALRAAISAEFSSARAGIDAAFAASKGAFVDGRLTLAQWKAGGQPAAPAPTQLPTIVFPSTSVAAERPITQPLSHEARDEGWRTEYLDHSGELAFTDYRSVILVHQIDRSSVEAALLLAAGRWDRVRVSGSQDFLSLCAAVATERCLQIVDDSGKSLIRDGRTTSNQIKEERVAPIKPDAAKLPQTQQSKSDAGRLGRSDPADDAGYGLAEQEFMRRRGISR